MAEARKLMDIHGYLSEGEPELCVLKTQHSAVSTHGHSFYELVYIREGSCLHDADGRMMLIMAGDLLVIRPGERHRYIANHDIKLYNCMFTPEALGEDMWNRLRTLDTTGFLEGAKNGDFPFRAHLGLVERASVEQRLQSLIAMRADKARGWELAQGCELALLLVECARIFDAQYTAAGDGRPYVGYVTQALYYIDEHYGEDLSIQSLAKSVGVSGDYFTRQFKQVTGVTPVDYLRRYRFARAMELLKAGGSVSEVSEQVGFRNLCHFSREFKNQLGVTPSEYRKRHRAPVIQEE